MKEKIIETKIYVAEDGKEFNEKYKCKNYENYLNLDTQRYSFLSSKLTSLIQSLNNFDEVEVKFRNKDIELFENDKRVYEIYDRIEFAEFKTRFLDVAYIRYGYIHDNVSIVCMFSTR